MFRATCMANAWQSSGDTVHPWKGAVTRDLNKLPYLSQLLVLSRIGPVP